MPPHVRRSETAAVPEAHSMSWWTGAGEGIRTLDPDLGKVVLYP